MAGKPKQVPHITVYTRHNDKCKRRGKFDQNNGCTCPKTLVWYRDGKLHRVAADTYDNATALTKAKTMMENFARAISGEPVPAITHEEKSQRLIENAIAMFLESKRNKFTKRGKITDKHVAKLDYELHEFLNFCTGRGLVALGDVQTEHVLAWRNALDGAQNTRAKKVFRLIGFFEFFVELGWLPRNPARSEAIKIEYSDDQKPKALSDEQVERLFSMLPQLNGRTTDFQRIRLRSMLLLMFKTGLSLRDAVCMERVRFVENGNGFTKLLLRRAKTKHNVYCILPTAVAREILAGANDGRYLYIDAVPTTEKDKDALVQEWGRLMSKLGSMIAFTDEESGSSFTFTSHCCRHTFVRWCFEHEIPLEDVAEMIGDSPMIVAKHYSGWVRSRQDRLEARMIDAYSDNLAFSANALQ